MRSRMGLIAAAAMLLSQTAVLAQAPSAAKDPEAVTVTGSMCGGGSIGKEAADAGFFAATCLLAKPDYCGRDAPQGFACAIACFMPWRGVGVLFNNPNETCVRTAQILRVYPDGRGVIVVLDDTEIKCLLPEQLIKYGSFQLAHVMGYGANGGDPKMASVFIVNPQRFSRLHGHYEPEPRKACDAYNAGGRR